MKAIGLPPLPPISRYSQLVGAGRVGRDDITDKR